MSKKKEVFYRQCVLQKGNTQQTAWIPEKFADTKKIVEISGDDGWHVTAVGSTRLDSKTANSMSRVHLQHRKASDI